MSTVIDKTGNEIVQQQQDHAVKYVPFGERHEISLKWSHVKQWIQVQTRSGKSAEPRDIIKFIKLCEAQLLNPWVGDAYLVGYDSKNGPTFSLIVSYQALAKRAEANEQYDGIEAGCLVQTKDGALEERPGAFTLAEDQLMGAYARAWRKDRAHPYEVRIKRSAYDKRRSRWSDDPEGMLVKCAKAQALREMFPSITSGLYISEELDAMKESRSIDDEQSKLPVSNVNEALAADVPEREIVPEQAKVQAAAEETSDDDGDVTEVLADCEAMLDGCSTLTEIDVVEKQFSQQLLSTSEKLAVSAAIAAKRKELQ